MATARPAKRRPQRASATPADEAFHPVPQVERRRRRQAEDTPRPGRFPKEAVVWMLILGGLSYVSGWYSAQQGLIPGVFLASDVGLAALFTLTLRTLARIVRARIPADDLATPGAAVAKAGAWALGVFWFFATLTNVLQLAIGLAAGIVGYQLFATKARLERSGLGHATRFGPAAGSVFLLLGAYGAWMLVRTFAGPLPGFDAASAAYGVIVMMIAIRITDRNAKGLVGTPTRAPAPKAKDDKQRDLEKRTIAAVIVGYLFFRFFISSAIPYGPIVEWFLVCIGALFVALVMADRIGVVPTRRALPHPDARVHIQRILSLPDRSLEEADERLTAFIRRGEDADWIAARFRALYTEAGVPQKEADAHLAAFAVTKDRRARYAPVAALGLEARERLVTELLDVLRQRRRGGTGTLKTTPNVRTQDKAPRPVVIPAP